MEVLKMDETIKYLQETGLTKQDIEETFQELIKLKEAIRTAQHKINNGKGDELLQAYMHEDAEQLHDIASDAKMEIFKIWHLAETGRKYDC